MIMKETLYPLFFKPVYMPYIWGGQKIAHHYGRTIPDKIVAESWEITDRPEGMSVLTNGPLAGKTLRELVEQFGRQLTGTSVKSAEFPLLIKIIDAKTRLSVQVHPDANTAAKYGGEPKTEAWYVLKAERGSHIYAGLRPNFDRIRFENTFKKGSLEKTLRTFPARKGSVFYIPGGRMHAIGEGCMLLEIQQNSNTTYRVYDWGRTDKNGNMRELHVEKAMNVINWNDHTPALLAPPPRNRKHGSQLQANLLSSPYFRLGRRIISGSCEVANDGKSFHILFTEQGEVEIIADGNSAIARAGTTCLMPASIAAYRLAPAGKSTGSVLTICVA
jgi:mannose-6-phosphate isomerase